jgi:pyridoxamine 5'-phosphate oxidase
MEHIHDYIRGHRSDYGADYTDLTKITEDPFYLFATWFDMALQAKSSEPHAMVLSSVSAACRPSSRVVLLRDFSTDGFTFYTNYLSRKGSELTERPVAALNFFWPELEKQIRIEGMVSRVPAEASETYFNSRPRESQIGAIASLQSKPLASRAELDQKVEILTKQFEGQPVPRPDTWGGFNLKPDYFEFWQGRENRLHDRIEYKFINDKWLNNRLYP